MELSVHCEQCEGGPEMLRTHSDFLSFEDRVQFVFRCPDNSKHEVSIWIHK